jgi:hypothetical protein
MMGIIRTSGQRIRLLDIGQSVMLGPAKCGYSLVEILGSLLLVKSGAYAALWSGKVGRLDRAKMSHFQGHTPGWVEVHPGYGLFSQLYENVHSVWRSSHIAKNV